jgi:hypothetical protein
MTRRPVLPQYSSTTSSVVSLKPRAVARVADKTVQSIRNKRKDVVDANTEEDVLCLLLESHCSVDLPPLPWGFFLLLPIQKVA